MSRTLTGWSFWGTRGSRGTEAPARQPGTHVNPLQRAGPIRVRAEIPSATRKRPFLNHAYFSVIVVVTPARRFGRDRLGQAGSDRHVLEDPASLVPQQREPCWLFPGAAHQQNVEVAVVIKVGMGDIEDEDLVAQVRPGRAILEGTVTIVDEHRRAFLGIDRCDQKVRPTIVVEVIEDPATRLARSPHAQASGCGDIVKPADVELGAKAVERNKIGGRNALGVFAQGHVGDVQEPSGSQVIGCILQVGRELLDRLA